jgi:hypothetical protein
MHEFILNALMDFLKLVDITAAKEPYYVLTRPGNRGGFV